MVHFAGEVEYSVANFLDKNRDALSSLAVRVRFRTVDVIDVFSMRLICVGCCDQAMKNSASPYYASLVAELDESSQAQRRRTAGGQFQEQLGSLMAHLNRCSPHYVRCIKPNRQQVPVELERDSVLRQLRYAGVLETVRIRGAGFPNRRSLPAFLERYRLLAPFKLRARIQAALAAVPLALRDPDAEALAQAPSVLSPSASAAGDALDAVDAVSAAMAAEAAAVEAQVDDSTRADLSTLASELLEHGLNVPAHHYRVGRTKVFVRDAAFHALEGCRNRFFHSQAAIIQARYRGFRLRRWYVRLRASARYLQYYLRQYLQSQDRTQEVGQCLDKLRGGSSGGAASAGAAVASGDATSAVRTLESLCKREKNVETVIEQGGIDVIVSAMAETTSGASPTADETQRELITASTRALGRMAISQENAALVARAGAVRSMLQTIEAVKDKKGFQPATNNAVQLIGMFVVVVVSYLH